jgi:hypothetical protein
MTSLNERTLCQTHKRSPLKRGLLLPGVSVAILVAGFCFRFTGSALQGAVPAEVRTGASFRAVEKPVIGNAKSSTSLGEKRPESTTAPSGGRSFPFSKPPSAAEQNPSDLQEWLLGLPDHEFRGLVESAEMDGYVLRVCSLLRDQTGNDPKQYDPAINQFFQSINLRIGEP